MLYYLSQLAHQVTLLNLFRYLTFRAGGAVLTALFVSFVFGPATIRWLRSRQSIGQPIRTDGPKGHLITKQGTPTMGGVLMLLGIGSATVLWADLNNRYIWVALFVTIGYGLIGFADDYLKVTKRSVGGLKGKAKLVAEIVIALAAAYWITVIAAGPMAHVLALPFF